MSDETSKRTKAGWYAHPQMADTRRYWDGSSWTQHIAPAEPKRVSSPGAGSTYGIAEAQRVARAIDIIKWVLLLLLAVGAVVVVTLSVLTDVTSGLFSGGTLLASAAILGVISLYALFIWVALGWAQHTLGMLATIARNTSR